MGARSVLWLLLGVVACSNAYSIQSEVETLGRRLGDSLLNDGSDDLGEARKTLPDPELESNSPPTTPAALIGHLPGGAKKALPAPKFPYLKGTNSSTGKQGTNSSRVKKEQPRKLNSVNPLDFNKALLDSLKLLKVKPPCATTPWSAWSECKADCHRNQISQGGAAYKSRTRTLYQEGSRKQKQRVTQTVDHWKKRISLAEQMQNQTAVESQGLEISTKQEIGRLMKEKEDIYTIASQVKIDMQIAKLQSRVRKARREAEQAAIRTVKVKRMARVAKAKQAEEANNSEEALARAVNAPPYCKEVELFERRECPDLEFCPIDCKVNEWEPWPACRADKCSLEFAPTWTTHHRSRTVLQDARHNGTKCPVIIEQQPCTDVSCVWKITDESRFKLTRCTDLLESKQFEKWSQQWVEQQESTSLQSLFTAIVSQLAQHTETLEIVDAYHLAMKGEVVKQCKVLRGLPTILSMPPETTNVAPVCLSGMRKMCRNSRWPIRDSCLNLAKSGCEHLQKTMKLQLSEFHSRVAIDRDALTADAGKELWGRCFKVLHFSTTMIDSMFGTVDLRQQQLELSSKVQIYRDRINELAEKLKTYSKASLQDDKGNNWACTRRDGADLREQSFECMKSVDGPYQGIVCKGKQAGRILRNEKLDKCDGDSAPQKLDLLANENSMQHDLRTELSDASVGCSCPAGSTVSNSQCCRAGEIPVTEHVGPTPEINCQCPVGMEFISVVADPAGWRFRCQVGEHEVGESQCNADSLLRTSSSICCQRMASQCLSKCQQHEFRLFDGKCMSSAMYGCDRYDAAAYKARTQPVQCLLTMSESILTQKDCVESGVALWITDETNSSSPIGRPYCKRSQNHRASFYKNCSFNIQTDPSNSLNCGSFEPSSFAHPVTQGNDVKAEYFIFVKQTVMFEAGISSTTMGLRKPSASIESEELPGAYVQYNPAQDMMIEAKAENMIPDPAETSERVIEVENNAENSDRIELLQTSESKYDKIPFLVVTTQFGMTSWDDHDPSGPADVQDPPNVQDPPKRRLFAQMNNAAEFDPVEDGMSSGLSENMKALSSATLDYDKAMGTHTSAPRIEGSRRGSQAKICVPPAHIASCLTGFNPHRCLSAVDMAWFQMECANF